MTIEYRSPRDINLTTFKNTEFRLGAGTLPKKLTPVDILLNLKHKEKLEREQTIEAKKQRIDNNNELDEDEKRAAKKRIERTDGYYKIKTYILDAKTLRDYNSRLVADIWENKKIPIFWNKKDGKHVITSGRVWGSEKCQWVIFDDNSGKAKTRNNTIEKIRERFLSSHKTGRASYENLGHYDYKSDYHKEMFLKETQDLKLDRKPEPRAKEEYDFEASFYHAVNIHDKITAKRFFGATSKIDREKQYAELGSAENPFDISLINKGGSK